MLPRVELIGTVDRCPDLKPPPASGMSQEAHVPVTVSDGDHSYIMLCVFKGKAAKRVHEELRGNDNIYIREGVLHRVDRDWRLDVKKFYLPRRTDKNRQKTGRPPKKKEEPKPMVRRNGVPASLRAIPEGKSMHWVSRQNETFIRDDDDDTPRLHTQYDMFPRR